MMAVVDFGGRGWCGLDEEMHYDNYKLHGHCNRYYDNGVQHHETFY